MKHNTIFTKIYNETYNNLLRYIIVHSNNLNDVKDILQEVYIEFYKKINKHITNYEPYLFGIAKIVIKRHNHKLFKLKEVPINEEISNDNYMVEKQVLSKIDLSNIWNYLKNKSITTAKIFYPYYIDTLTIKEISSLLNLNESTIKNHLYRTKKEIINAYKEKV